MAAVSDAHEQTQRHLADIFVYQKCRTHDATESLVAGAKRLMLCLGLIAFAKFLTLFIVAHLPVLLQKQQP